MKRIQMLLFFSTVLAIYSLVNIYISFKLFYAIPGFQNHKVLYSIAFFLITLIFIIAKVLESKNSSFISDVLNILGGFWLAFMLYGFLFFLLSDIVLLFLRIPGILSGNDLLQFRKWSSILIVLISSLLIGGGFINALIPVVTKYNITISKPAGEVKTMRIAAVSDIHLGSIIRKRSIKKLSAMLTSADPDIILILGDLVDGEIGPVLRGDLLKYFDCSICKDGLYAITGNHEFIGGAHRTIPYIESKGIRILKDEVVLLKGGVQLIGRIDRDASRFYRMQRLPLSELMKKADISKPVIVLDHQPVHLDESVNCGVDLQLSGHTHNGQMWPLNFLTAMIFELSYGHIRKGNTDFIVSSGYGLWGPRVRLGSRSEILLIEIKFAGKENSAQ